MRTSKQSKKTPFYKNELLCDAVFLLSHSSFDNSGQLITRSKSFQILFCAPKHLVTCSVGALHVFNCQSDHLHCICSKLSSGLTEILQCYYSTNLKGEERRKSNQKETRVGERNFNNNKKKIAKIMNNNDV